MRKARVMVIAPYEGLMETVDSVLPNFGDSLEATLVLGDLGTGITHAAEAEKEGYDLIISRGGTAEMIKQHTSIPVINIEISGFDYIRAIKLAENIKCKKAFVGFSYITQRAKSVNDLLKTDVEIFTVFHQEEILPLLKGLLLKGFELIIGDVATCQKANELGIKNMLLISGQESVCNALENAIAWIEMNSMKQHQIQIYQEVIAGCSDEIAILDSNGRVTFSSKDLSAYSLDHQDLVDISRNLPPVGEGVYLKHFDKGLVRISVKTIKNGESVKSYAFYFHLESNQSQQNAGIIVHQPGWDMAGQRAERYSSCHTSDLLSKARAFAATSLPVLIIGDTGVGKSDLACYIYHSSSQGVQPYIQINCGIAGLSSIENLLSYGKQILQNGAVLCFELLDLLGNDTQAYLCDALDSGIFASCRFLATARPRILKMAADGAFSEPLFDFFSELCLTLPDVSMSYPDLQRIVNLYIMQANNRYGRQLTGADDKALDLIKKKVWEGNFSQLQQTVHQAVLISKGFYLSADDMSSAIAAREITGDNEDTGINLDGTLQVIEMRILHKVLKEEGGNLTMTANRLGIARSTLWRKLRELHPKASFQ